MDASTWANLIAGVALAGTVVGIGLNRRDVRASQRDSAHAEERAEAAEKLAERATAAHERSARALELVAIANARGNEEPEPAWQLTWHTGDAFLLENVGTGPAYDVTVEPGGDHVIFRDTGPAETPEMQPQDSKKFLMVLTLASKDDSVIVRWRESPVHDVKREWRRSLPPKR